MTERRNNLWLTLLSTIGIIVVVLSLFVYTMTQPRVMSVKELVSNGAITYEEPKPLSPLAFTDQHGQAFTEESLRNQWTLLFFGFSHCADFCPTTLALLNELTAQLDKDIAAQTQIIMVSVDPERDSPARLSEYMATFNQNFIGLSGNLAQIQMLADQLYISFQMPHTAEGHEDHHYQVAHGEQIALINPQGQYHGFFKPPFTLARLKTTYQSIVITYDR